MNGPSLGRRLLVGVVIVLLALGLLLGRPGDEEFLTDSVASPAPDGRRALSALFTELGLRPVAWRQAPFALPREGGLLWAAGGPSLGGKEPEATEEESVAEEPEAGLLTADPRHPAHYARFVEAGGVLVLPADEQQFLIGALTEALPAVERIAHEASAAARLSIGGETLEVRAEAHLVVAGGAGEERVDILFRDEQGRAHTLAIDIGRGRLVLIADDGFLDNETLGELDHALWAVRLVEVLAAGEPLLFDEYALGAWAPPGKLALALGAGARGVTLHLVVLLGLLLWLHAWRREFPRDPAFHARLSPLARARSAARLLERAGRFDLLAEQLRKGVAAQVARRAGLPRNLKSADERLAALAARLEARGIATPAAALAEARAVHSARDLEHLARGLEALEAALEDDLAGGRTMARERGVA
jgi:hypothetical protein